MKIRILNPCLELQKAGMKPGDEVEATPGSELTGSMYFTAHSGTRKFECVVWPENYEIISEPESVCQSKTKSK